MRGGCYAVPLTVAHLGSQLLLVALVHAILLRNDAVREQLAQPSELVQGRESQMAVVHVVVSGHVMQVGDFGEVVALVFLLVEVFVDGLPALAGGGGGLARLQASQCSMIGIRQEMNECMPYNIHFMCCL